MNAVVVEHVGKRYQRYSAHRPRSFQEAFLRGFRKMGAEGSFWALRDVSFTLAPGKMLGLIGANGAGKSTLLRLIGGVGQPDAGTIHTHGRIGALIDLGAGFHGDLTGRENVYVNGVISGLTRVEIRRRFDAMVAFAALETFIDSPLRTYSSGMQMRLAFAIAAHIEPEILLIDEVLAVGDLAFQQKCLERIAEFKAGGCAIVYVSHDAGQVGRICDEALWLRGGQVAALGPAELTSSQYAAEMHSETRRRTPTETGVQVTPAGIELRLRENRFGSQEARITAVRLSDRHGLPAHAIDPGAPLRVEIDYVLGQPALDAIIGLTISKEDGTVCYDASSATAGPLVADPAGAGKAALFLERLDLIGGKYYLDVGLYPRDWAYAYDYHWRAYPLEVRPTPGEKGVVKPPVKWDLG